MFTWDLATHKSRQCPCLVSLLLLFVCLLFSQPEALNESIMVQDLQVSGRCGCLCGWAKHFCLSSQMAPRSLLLFQKHVYPEGRPGEAAHSWCCGCVLRQSSAPENKLTLMAAFTHHAEPGLPSKGSLENLWLAGHLNLLYGVSSCLQQSLSTFLAHVSAFLHFSILPEQLPEVLVTGFIHFCNSEP